MPVKNFSGRFGTLIDLAVLSAGEFLGILLGMVAFAYLARALGPEVYGAVELAVSITLIFSVAVDLGSGAIGAREVARDRSLVPRFAAEIPAARLVLAALAIPLMGAVAMIMRQPPATVRLVWIFSLSLLAFPWNHRWLLQGLQLTAWVSGARAIRMLIFVLAVLVLVHGPGDVYRVGVAEIFATAGLAGYYLVVQQRRITPIRFSLSGSGMRYLLREGVPLGLTQMVWTATQYLPTLLVAALAGGTALAWFGAAHRIVMSLWAFSWLYHFNLFPMLVRSLAESPDSCRALVRPSLKVTAWAGTGFAMVVSILATWLCQLIFGRSFAAAGSVLALLVWMLPATLLSGHARSVLIAAGLQQEVLRAQLAGAAVMLALAALLVPAFGASGAAMAMVLSSVAVWGVSHLQAVRKVMPMPGIGTLLRPALAAAAAGVPAVLINADAWLKAALSVLVFCVLALLLDRRVVVDFHLIAGLRRSQEQSV